MTGDARDALVIEVTLPRILVGALGMLYVALASTSHGLVAIAGVAGGLVVVTLVITRPHISRAALVAGTTVAVTPFAVLTWWSIVTPLIAALTIVLTWRS